MEMSMRSHLRELRLHASRDAVSDNPRTWSRVLSTFVRSSIIYKGWRLSLRQDSRCLNNPIRAGV